jgi:transposase-like protein
MWYNIDMDTLNTPTTLQDAVIFFSNPDNCYAFMVNLRWPDSHITCPRCGSDNVKYLPNARVFKCFQKHPCQKFSLKVGTIFEDSPIGLDKWLPVMWMLVNCKNGVSSWEIHRAVGVTQKTAWFMLQRARLAMQDGETGGKLGGEVEVDETFIGGLARNMHKDKRAEKITGTGPSGKAIVAAVLQRGGKVRATVVENRRKKSLQQLVRENVKAGSNVYTDALKSYEGLDEFKHEVIDHAEAYVRENVHTNGLENFWSLLKRGIRGTYVSVEPFHLFRYLDEQAFRYNNREETDDSGRFVAAMKQAVGKRLTYKQLTGKVEMGAAS